MVHFNKMNFASTKIGLQAHPFPLSYAKTYLHFTHISKILNLASYALLFLARVGDLARLIFQYSQTPQPHTV